MLVLETPLQDDENQARYALKWYHLMQIPKLAMWYHVFNQPSNAVTLLTLPCAMYSPAHAVSSLMICRRSHSQIEAGAWSLFQPLARMLPSIFFHIASTTSRSRNRLASAPGAPGSLHLSTVKHCTR